MTVVETAKNGVVNKDTIFSFTQKDYVIEANYTGGKIKKGFLIGTIKEHTFDFSYCQLQTDDVLDNGRSSSKLTVTPEGKIRLVENFEWSSRPGASGTNIFEEI